MRLAALERGPRARPTPARRRGRRCGPTCAAAPAGSPSSRRRATRSAVGDGARCALATPRATRCWPPGGPRSRARPSRVSGPDVVLGGGGFADDTAPPGALVAARCRRDPSRPSLRAARAGPRPACRAATARCRCPTRSRCPTGDWALTLQTTWVEPAYVEPDASWCLPGGHPASPLANGGAFGGKRRSPVPAPRPRPGRRRRGEAVRVAVAPRGRRAAGARSARRWPSALRPDGSGVVRVGSHGGLGRPGPLVARVAAAVPRRGRRAGRRARAAGRRPSLRGAGWAEVLAARAGARGPAARRRARRGRTSRCPAPGAPASRSASTTGSRGRGRGRRVGRRDPRAR